jgi:hypothetical protein
MLVGSAFLAVWTSLCIYLVRVTIFPVTGWVSMFANAVKYQREMRWL